MKSLYIKNIKKKDRKEGKWKGKLKIKGQIENVFMLSILPFASGP